MTPEGLNRLISDEGTKLYLYDDKTGERVTKLPSGGNPSIGIGLNLGAQELTEEEVKYLFNNRLTIFWDDIVKLLPWVVNIPSIDQDVILMIEYNTGDVFTFRKMLKAFQNNDPITASNELMNSTAARQLPERYTRMRDAILNCKW